MEETHYETKHSLGRYTARLGDILQMTAGVLVRDQGGALGVKVKKDHIDISVKRKDNIPWIAPSMHARRYPPLIHGSSAYATGKW